MTGQSTPSLPYKGYSIVPWVHKWGYWTLPRSGRYGTFCKMVEMSEVFVDEEESEV